MARLATAGAELQFSAASFPSAEFNAISGTVGISTTTVRSGAAAYSMATNPFATLEWNNTTVAGVQNHWYYARTYWRTSATLATDTAIMAWYDTTGTHMISEIHATVLLEILAFTTTPARSRRLGLIAQTFGIAVRFSATPCLANFSQLFLFRLASGQVHSAR